MILFTFILSTISLDIFNESCQNSTRKKIVKAKPEVTCVSDGFYFTDETANIHHGSAAL